MVSWDESPAERWMPIPGYVGYEASDQGRIRSVERFVAGRSGRISKRISVILKQRINPGRGTSYWTAAMSFNGKTIQRYVGRLVLAAFICPRPEGMECCHGTSGSLNDRLENLRWGTKKENELDKVRHGTQRVGRGERHASAKLTEADVRLIRSSALRHAELARQLNVSWQCVWSVRRGETWRHVT